MEADESARFFFYPANEKRLLKTRFAEIHHARLRSLLPVLVIVGVFLLGSDIVRITRGPVPPPYHWYFVLDLGFVAFQAGALVTFLIYFRASKRRPRSVPSPAILSYAALTLTWAAPVAAIELQQTGNVSTIIIAGLAAALLLLVSAIPFCLLIFGSAAIFLFSFVLFFGHRALSFERVEFLFALIVVSILVSRSLFSAFVHNPLGFIKSNFSTLAQSFRHFMRGTAHFANDATSAFLVANIEKIFADTEEEFRRISQVIDNLRSFSHVAPEGYFGLYNINRGIESALIIARDSYRRIARIVQDLGAAPEVEARGSEINQVLLNILLNAVKARASLSPMSEGTVTIATRVHCSISDSGPGVRAEIHRRIFDPFFTTRPVGEGLGLGLSLSYEIVVNRHHGSLVLLDSLPTTFRVSSPIRQTPPRYDTGLPHQSDPHS